MSREGTVRLACFEFIPCGGRQLHRHLVPFPIAQAVRYGPAQAEGVIPPFSDILSNILELDRKAVSDHYVGALAVVIRVRRIHQDAKMENVPGVPVGRQIARGAYEAICAGHSTVLKTKPVIRPVSIVELQHLVVASFRIVDYLGARGRFKIGIDSLHEKDVVIAQRRGLRMRIMRNDARKKQDGGSAPRKAGHTTVSNMTEMISKMDDLVIHSGMHKDLAHEMDVVRCLYFYSAA